MSGLGPGVWGGSGTAGVGSGIADPGSHVTNGALVWNGSAWVNQTIVDANIAAGAAIAKSKLAALAIADADVAAGAAIAKSKLALTGNLVFADLASAAVGPGATSIARGDHRHGLPEPADHGYIGWAFPAFQVLNNVTLTSGTLRVIKVWVPDAVRASKTVTNILIHVQAAGVTLTANQNIAAVVNQSGALIGTKTGDQSGNWNSTGLKTMALGSTGTISTDWVWVVLLSVGATPPGLGRIATQAAAIQNAGLTTANFNQATNATGQTDITGITPGSNVSAADSIWVALS